jgi:hypothetical protein
MIGRSLLRKAWVGLSRTVSSGYPILLDYPLNLEERYGYGKPPHPMLAELLKKYAENFRSTLRHCRSLQRDLNAISMSSSDGNPRWDNIWFSGLDAASLYSILVQNNPRLFLEIGSGHSTRFAKRAIRDHNLKTRILSLDPTPRVEIDSLCDDVIRMPLELATERITGQVEPGDILFFDGSHRVFQNSDVTVFFLDILPNLKPGVIVHIHDIFLPFDYPKVWRQRYYSEQYMLASWLLAAPSTANILFASAFVGHEDDYSAEVNAVAGPGYALGVERMRLATGGFAGVSFWMKS